MYRDQLGDLTLVIHGCSSIGVEVCPLAHQWYRVHRPFPID